MYVSVRNLKARLSRYLREVHAGRDVVVTSRGKPVARLLAVSEDAGEKSSGKELLRRLKLLPGVRLGAGGKPRGGEDPDPYTIRAEESCGDSPGGSWLILYLDTSALVKLYAEEVGSELVRQGVRASHLIATSLMSYAETRSALARKSRGREISHATFTRCKREFDRDWLRLHRLPVDEPLIRKSGELAEEHALRALGASTILNGLLKTLFAFVHLPTIACAVSCLAAAAQAGELASRHLRLQRADW